MQADCGTGVKRNETEKDPGPSQVSLELIAASQEVGIQVMAEICQSPMWICNAS